MHLSPDMEWHEGKFNPQEWMVENVLREAKNRNEKNPTY